ncbi:hypothetical protein HY638_06075 [Candidatus Woesearchaeota archaeon]|nr:hypothetical protein [Candidatus Woesearchaeota archaeon]
MVNAINGRQKEVYGLIADSELGKASDLGFMGLLKPMERHLAAAEENARHAGIDISSKMGEIRTRESPQCVYRDIYNAERSAERGEGQEALRSIRDARDGLVYCTRMDEKEREAIDCRIMAVLFSLGLTKELRKYASLKWEPETELNLLRV